MTKKQQQEPTQPHLIQLPLLGTVVIYTRVATKDKLPQRELSQVDSLVQFAQTLGYNGERITMFTDEGTQAAAPLFEREGYLALVTAIRAGNVNVLLVSDISRLLADAEEEQLNAFIHLCMEKGTFVVTPVMVYDFSNLALIAIFRRHCMQAFQVLQAATN